MRILDHVVLWGANLYAPVPVGRMALDLSDQATAVQDSTVDHALDQISEVLPWVTRSTSLTTSKEIGRAALLAALVTRCALAVQREFGFEVSYGSVARSRQADAYNVTYEYRDPAHRILAGTAAVALVQAAMTPKQRDVDDEFRDSVGPGLAETLADHLEVLRKKTFGVVTRRLIWEAERRGIPWSRVLSTPGVVRLGQGHLQKQFRSTYSSETAWLGTIRATSKSGASNMLRAHGIPVPRHVLVTEVEESLGAASTLGYPLVVKPNETDMGTAVTIGIEDEESLRAAFAVAREYGSVLVEQQISGNDHRITVVKGRMAAAGRNMNLRVIGDGEHTIQDLIEIENRNPRRGTKDYSILEEIRVDEEIERTLQDQGYRLESVPPAGIEVALRTWWRHSNDGWGLDVTADVHPENQAMLERAVRLVGLDIAGVDFVTPDISRPWYEVGGAINEVNPTPGLNTHVKAGTPNINKIILESFFPPGRDGRIPTALLVQSDFDPALADRVAGILQQAGHQVGLATARDLRIGGYPVVRSALHGPDAMHLMLGDPATTAAVIATSSSEFGNHGLGVAQVSVCALRNGLGAGQIEEAGFLPEDVERLLLSVTDRLVVLDSDDDFSSRVETEGAAARVCWIARRPDLGRVAGHIAAGGTAVAVAEVAGRPTIALWDRGAMTPLVPLAESVSPEGERNLDARSDALFAVAIAHGLGLAPRDIAAGLALGGRVEG